MIPGDGVGPEIVRETRRVLDRVGEVYGYAFTYTEVLMGGVSIDVHGVPPTDEALKTAGESDAVLLGAAGGGMGNSRWYGVVPSLRPEAGPLAIRRGLNLFANTRPAYLYKKLVGACPLKKEIIDDGLDVMIMRELADEFYSGERHTEEVNGVMTTTNTSTYNKNEIRRIAIKAFGITVKRRKQVTNVDRASVLDSSRLQRKVVERMAKDYPEVKLTRMLVNNCVIQLVMNLGQFNVVLTENMSGDVLSDEANMITGSIRVLFSASLNESRFGMYEPSHGSAPDIVDQDTANPIVTILSVTTILRYSSDLDQEAGAVEKVVQKVLTDGYHTSDTWSGGREKAGTVKMGDLAAVAI